jgi:hypothetical protein
MMNFTIPGVAGLALLMAMTSTMASHASARADEAANHTSTSSTYDVTSSTRQDYDNERMFGLFPDRPIATLKIHVKSFTDYGPDSFQCLFYGPGVYVGPGPVYGEHLYSFAGLPKGELNRSQAVFHCGYSTHESHGPLDVDDIQAVLVEGRDSSGKLVPTSICQLWSSDYSIPVPGPDVCREACGDAICDGGEPNTLDAFAVLRGSIGLFRCPLRLCDVNHDGAVRTLDSLRVLRRAVGLRSVLLCTASDTECERVD